MNAPDGSDVKQGHLLVGDLVNTAYFVIPLEPYPTDDDHLSKFYKWLREAIICANAEVCLARTLKLTKPAVQGQPSRAEQPGSAVDIKLVNPNPLGRFPLLPISDDENIRKELTRWHLAADQLRMLPTCGMQFSFPRSGNIGLREVQDLLDKACSMAKEELRDAEINDMDLLLQIIKTFAAYQPDVADADNGQMETDGQRFTLKAPQELAHLAIRLLEKAHGDVLKGLFAGLLEAAFMSGNKVLVRDVLKKYKTENREAYVSVVIQALCDAWAGYFEYAPLQTKRAGALAHSEDWLDYHHSQKLAKDIASYVLEFILDSGGDLDAPDTAWESTWKILCKRPVACQLMANAIMDYCDTSSSLSAKLWVQAFRIAVFSHDLNTVKRALNRIQEDIKTWSKELDLELLYNLAAHFPKQCANILNKITLEVVSSKALKDVVLPFSLPDGIQAVLVSRRCLSDDNFEQHQGFKYRISDQSAQRGILTKDADFLSTQRFGDETIDAFLPMFFGAWFGIIFLFLLAEFHNPAIKRMMRILGCSGLVVGFLLYGFVGTLFGTLLGCILFIVGGILTRVAAFAIFLCSSIMSILAWLVSRPRRGKNRIHNNSNLGRILHSRGTNNRMVRLGRLGFCISFNFPRYFTMSSLVGWGTGATHIRCRKVPFPVRYGDKQYDTRLMEALIHAHNVNARVFSTEVLEALILFKWNYFVKYFIALQLVLHIVYMVVFIMYAFSIKDMDPVNGRDPGRFSKGGNHCRIPVPSDYQIRLLGVLAVITFDYIVGEGRQFLNAALFSSQLSAYTYLANPWNFLNCASVLLMAAIIVLQPLCYSVVTPMVLRAMASVQILLLFGRLLYYTLAFEVMGNFVRMVFHTASKLVIFLVFLAAVFCGFALSVVVAQGKVSDELSTVFKLYTMTFGDFDVDFLDRPWNADGGEIPEHNVLLRVLAALYMVVVAIVLLNLLIAIINESYEKVREQEKSESLRNKAMLIVSTEGLLRGYGLWTLDLLFCQKLLAGSDLITWVYKRLTQPPEPAENNSDDRYIYVLEPDLLDDQDKGKEDQGQGKDEGDHQGQEQGEGQQEQGQDEAAQGERQEQSQSPWREPDAVASQPQLDTSSRQAPVELPPIPIAKHSANQPSQ